MRPHSHHKGTQPKIPKEHCQDGIDLSLPDCYYYGLFNMQLPRVIIGDHGGDVMGCIYMIKSISNIWILKYRFRYYAGDPEGSDPFSPEDRKSWHIIGMPVSKEKAIESVHELLNALKIASLAIVGCSTNEDWIIFEGDCKRVMVELQACTYKYSWLHMREEPADQCENTNVDAPP